MANGMRARIYAFYRIRAEKRLRRARLDSAADTAAAPDRRSDGRQHRVDQIGVPQPELPNPLVDRCRCLRRDIQPLRQFSDGQMRIEV